VPDRRTAPDDLSLVEFDRMSHRERIALCRQRASQAREDAAQAKHGEPFLRLAEEWENLAEEMEQQLSQDRFGRIRP